MERATAEEQGGKTPIVEGLVRIILGFGLLGTILFLTAGGLDWPMAWAILAVLLVLLPINLVVLIRRNPEVIEARIRGGKGTETWDRIVVGFVALLAIAMLVVGGLDRRYGWSPAFALWLQVASIALIALGDFIFLWAMSVNKFFIKIARIQHERGHHVVTDGPYRYVRHPGYVGWHIMMAGLALALGSLWGLLPAATMMALMVVRTVLEDRMLRAELPGYEDYARRVRYRLLPGVW